MMKDILLVEDNTELARLIQDFLEKDGSSVWHVSSGEQALSYLEEHHIKLILLDIMLPEMDGFAVCRFVRSKWNMPVLIMSARAEKGDKLIGYELGADDYMEKPVDAEILIAKVNALLQRSYGIRTQTDILISGSLTVDQIAMLVYQNGMLVDMNAKEYELLLLFLQNPGKTLRKEYIFGTIWGLDSNSENQTLTVHIKMLRSKIEENPREPKRIQTVWGVGYRYEEL